MAHASLCLPHLPLQPTLSLPVSGALSLIPTPLKQDHVAQVYVYQPSETLKLP